MADCFLISPRADAITQHPCQSMGEFPCLGALPAIDIFFEPRSGEGRISGRDVGTEIAQQSEDRVAGGTSVEPHSP